MRRLKTFGFLVTTLVGLAVFFASPLAPAAPDISRAPAIATAKDAAKNQDKPTTMPALEKAATITPHRAIYNIKLAGTRNGSRISDITGHMMFSWVDDCTAWNMEQKMQLRFYYSEGDVSDTLSELISREAKDGSSYVFHLRRHNDGKGDDKNKDELEVLRGNAQLDMSKDGFGTGDATFVAAQDRHVALNNALFPAHHTLELLKHAREGKRFFAVNVFDGADETGLNEISAFINAPIEKAATVEKTGGKKGESLDDHALLQTRAWPIRMAFFAPDSQSSAPDYEMDMVLMDNGVIKNMTVDYGDFTMRADLASVVPLNSSACKTATP